MSAGFWWLTSDCGDCGAPAGTECHDLCPSGRARQADEDQALNPEWPYLDQADAADLESYFDARAAGDVA